MAWPTTNDRRTEFATLRMTLAEAAELDAFAGGNRSAFVREAVAEKIEREAKKAQASRRGGKIVQGD